MYEMRLGEHCGSNIQGCKLRLHDYQNVSCRASEIAFTARGQTCPAGRTLPETEHAYLGKHRETFSTFRFHFSVTKTASTISAVETAYHTVNFCWCKNPLRILL
jgi:hypothetical protein